MPIMTLTAVGLACVFLLMGTPFAVAFGLASAISITFLSPLPIEASTQVLATQAESFLLVAVPFFMMAGLLMESGGIGKRLIALANSLVGWAPGGLGSVTTFASLIFGGISGSSVADTVALGTLLIPEMEEQSYPREYAAALVSSSSVLSVIVPPSILMVVLGSLAQLPISDLLIGGVIPGFLVWALLTVFNIHISLRNGYGRRLRFSWGSFLNGLKQGITAVLAPLIILGGIGSGIVTPTEAAALAVGYSLLVGVFVHRELTLRTIMEDILKSCKASASIMFIVTASTLFSWILSYEQIPIRLASWLCSWIQSPTLFIVMVDLLLVFIGMWMDTVAALILVVPVLYPVVAAMGINPIYFGVLMVAGIAIGLITPPFGACLFSTTTISRVPVHVIVQHSYPFYVALVLALAILTFTPQLILFLPSVLLH